jgi:hypothetical protein
MKQRKKPVSGIVGYQQRCAIIDALSADPNATTEQIIEATGATEYLVQTVRGSLKTKLRMRSEERMEAHIAKMEGLVNDAISLVARAIQGEKPRANMVALKAAIDVLDRVGPSRSERKTHSGPDGGPITLKVIYEKESDRSKEALA